MAVTATVGSTLTVAETLSTNVPFAGSTTKTITHSGLKPA